MERNGDDGALRFEIVVRGRLTERFISHFDGVAMEARDGVTRLRGTLVDHAQLYGLIDRLRDLGLELVSVAAQEDGNERNA